MSGISITKYNFWKNQLIVENAIDIPSVRNKFFIYQDELNRDVFSIIPKLGDGMGRMYFNTRSGRRGCETMSVHIPRHSENGRHRSFFYFREVP